MKVQRTGSPNIQGLGFGFKGRFSKLFDNFD